MYSETMNAFKEVVDNSVSNAPNKGLLNIEDSLFAEKLNERYIRNRKRIDELDSILSNDEVANGLFAKVDEDLEDMVKLVGKKRAESTKEDFLVLGPYEDGSHTLIKY